MGGYVLFCLAGGGDDRGVPLALLATVLQRRGHSAQRVAAAGASAPHSACREAA